MLVGMEKSSDFGGGQDLKELEIQVVFFTSSRHRTGFRG